MLRIISCRWYRAAFTASNIGVLLGGVAPGGLASGFAGALPSSVPLLSCDESGPAMEPAPFANPKYAPTPDEVVAPTFRPLAIDAWPQGQLRIAFATLQGPMGPMPRVERHHHPVPRPAWAIQSKPFWMLS